MANEKINIDLVINTAQSAKTLKEQKNAIKGIQEALEEVKYGSGAFELLTEESKKLTDSIGLLNITFEDVYGNIKPLTGQLGELEDIMYQMALAGDTTSEEFKKIQAEAIRMRKTIIDVDTAVDSFADKGAKLRGVTQVVSGIAGGFAVAQGAIGLFGNASESIEKTLLKVQSTMAVLNGLQEINTLITEKNIIVQRILNSVMKANPIFIILGVITAVTAAWVFFTRETDNAADASKKLNDQLEFQNALLEESNRRALETIDAKIALAEAEGASSETLLALQLERIDQLEKAEEEALVNSKARIAELQRERTDADDDRREEINNEIKDLTKVRDAAQDSFKERAGFESKFALDRELLRKKSKKEEDEALKEVRLKNIESQKKRVEDYRKFIDKMNEINTTYNDRVRNQIRQISIFSLEGFDKEFDQLLVSQSERSEATKKFYNDEEKFLKDSLDNNIIQQNEYNVRLNQLQRKQLHEGFLNKELASKELEKFNKIVEDDNLKSTQEYGLKLIEIESLLLEIQYEKQKSFIDLTIDDERTKERLLIELNNKFKGDRLKLIERTYSEESKINKDNYTKTEKELNESLELNKKRVDLYNSDIIKAEEDVNTIKEFLSRERTEEERKSGEEALAIALANLNTQKEALISTQGIIINDKNKLLENEAVYAEKTLKLFKKTNDAKQKLEEDTTKLTKEELRKRIADYENFTAQSLVSSLQLLDSIQTQITQNRLSLIEQESQLKLDAIEEEKQAYLDSITVQTNAEKFKSDKLKEFEKKKADEEKKAQKEKDEAQYKGEIRAWEYSQLQATVNLANAMLKAAPNPFLLGTTATLGVLELATITANKPVKNFATGGLVTGPGGPTDDLIPANLSNGESVMNAKSTKMFLPLLDQINQLGGGSPLIKGGNGMSSGGSVTNVNVDNSQLVMMMEEFLNRPIKTYVTSSDITNTQNNDNRLKSRTSF